MKKCWTSVCYHPSKVVLVDDQKSYLRALKNDLEVDHATYRTFSDPFIAYKYLTQKYKKATFLDRCITRPEETVIDSRLMQIETRKIHQEMYRRDRFDEISVLVVDYSMPEMNGIKLCEMLQHLPIKKLLLTGKAEDSVAIKAFNNGIIDKFIRKECDDFSNIINLAVNELQHEYFNDQAEMVVNSLTQDGERDAACLDDPVFVKFFQQLCARKNPREFYLMDGMGSYMFLDMDGNPSWLTVKPDEEMRSMAQFAEFGMAPGPVINELKMRSSVPYFHSDHDLQTPPVNWGNFLYPANVLSGRGHYYYAFIDDDGRYDTNRKNLFSYRDYLSV